MTYRTSALIAIALTAGLFGCGEDSPTADKNSTSERSPKVESVQRLEIAGAATIRVTRGDTPSVTLRGTDELLDAVPVKTFDNTLRLGRDNFSDGKLDVALTTPDLQSVRVTDGGEVKLDGVDSDSLELALDGPGALRASGRTDELDARLKGTGELELTKLTARTGTVRLSGKGTARVNVTDELRAIVSGVGDIRYEGRPKLQREVTGLGDVKPLK